MKKKILVMALIFLAFDLASKLVVDLTLDTKNIEIIKHFFYLNKVYNDGASWSFLSGYNIVLILITLIILVILYFYEPHFKINNRNALAFGLLYGGIFGNLVNRLVLKHVIDFLDFKIFGYDFPVFNFADIFIVCGILLLSIAIIKKEDEV